MFNMENEKDLKEKSVLITGAAQGLGKAFAEKFLEKGAKFVYLLDIDKSLGKETEKYFLEKHPGKVLFIRCDVTDELDVIKAYKTIEETGHGLEVVINNAGICNEAFPLKIVDINIRGLIQSSLKAWNNMRKDKGGSGGTIINIASTAALGNFVRLPTYCATKAAVMMFSRCLGVEDHYSKTKVRVITACFGNTISNLVEQSVTKDVNQAELTFKLFPYQQRTESAADGLITMFEKGDSASVWLCESDKQAEDITERIQKAYETMYTLL